MNVIARKLTAAAALAVLALGAATASAAVIYTETYSANPNSGNGQGQLVRAGESFTFDFDMWFDNAWYVNDNSSLILTQDASGAFGPWNSAEILLGLRDDSDSWADSATVSLQVWGPFGPLFAGPYTSVASLNSVGNYTLNIGQPLLGALDNYGWGSIRVGAVLQGRNDFYINSIGLRVNAGERVTVPEPGTLLLLGLALLVLGGAVTLRRRRAN